MSVFDTDIIQQEYLTEHVYNVELLNAAYHSIYKNIRRIFKPGHYNPKQILNTTIQNGIDVITEGPIVDYFKKMPLVNFEKIMSTLKKDKDKQWERQYRVKWYLWRKMGVKWERLKDSHIDVGWGSYGGDFSIFIPNGAVIECATADGIAFVFKKKVQ
jgi:hypothetical protein